MINTLNYNVSTKARIYGDCQINAGRKYNRQSENLSDFLYIERVMLQYGVSETFDVSCKPLGTHAGCQRVGMPGLGSMLNNCCPTKRSNGGVVSKPLSIKLLFLAFPSRHLHLNQKEGVYVKSGRSGALKQDKLNLT